MDSVALLKSKTAAVVTTFAPDDSLEANLLSIVEQVALVILVDDTGDGGREVNLALDKVVVIRNPANVGIAKALNVGIAEAARRGFEWVITLDDDTTLRPDYLDLALSFVASGSVPNLGLVALSRPACLETAPQVAPGRFTRRRNIITSGSVLPMTVLNELGGFSEDLFIDLVDFDFCCRARKAGRTLVQLDTVGMAHRVGDSESRRWLGLATTVFHHAPFRLYYQARNTIVFAKRHMRFDPLLCLYLLVELVRLPTKAVLFERDKIIRLRFIGAGIRDALRGRLGRLS